MFRIASYNVRHCADMQLRPHEYAKDVKAVGALLCGFQEVDEYTSRCYLDTAKYFAEKTGYDCRFSKSIDYKGGEYGHCLLSYYKILSHETIPLYSVGCEGRSVGKSVVLIDGEEVQFLNTHLDHTNKERRGIQFKELFALVDQDKPYLITGDFNTADFTEFSDFVAAGASLANCDEHYLKSFISTGKGIDNIIVSKHFTIVNVGIYDEIHSDHKMIYADVARKKA